MWSVITKIFTKNSNNDDERVADDEAVPTGRVQHPDEMDDTKQVSQY